ncbi:cuticle protein 7 [Musca domestica]|uniref:Cuticle protein 7 n=1 Tax=Musca domestica TaxID=7370 RepID=A0A1I8MJC7_MUSDO|nr:cuticle protein 7 [Musca domestica]
MAFKFVAVLCLATLVAAGDYEYQNQGNGGYNGVQANEPQQKQQQPHQQNNKNVQQTDSYGNVANNDNQAYNEDSYAASGDYQYDNANYGYAAAPAAYYPPAKYAYNYEVNDPTTGDIKSHSETRDGYNVRGAYSLIDSDGFKRTVTYTADSVNGFNAVVNREPIALEVVAPVLAYKAIVPTTVNAPVVAAAPGNAAGQETKVNTASDVKDSYAKPPTSDGTGPYA